MSKEIEMESETHKPNSDSATPMRASYEQQWLLDDGNPKHLDTLANRPRRLSDVGKENNTSNASTITKNKKGTGQATPNNSSTPARKSNKEMTRAERRKLQEQQRAEKAAARAGSNVTASSKKPVQGSATISTGGGGGGGPTSETSVTSSVHAESGGTVRSVEPKQKDISDNSKQVALFSHLEIPKGANTSTAPKEIHPAVLVLGLHLAEFKICGANARCIATLTALQKVIN